MRNKRLALAVLLGVSLIGAAAIAVPPALERSDAPSLEIHTTVRPVREDQVQLLLPPPRDAYRFSAAVLSEPGGRSGFKPDDVVIRAGESGEASRTVGPIRVTLRARMIDAHRAESVVTVTRGDRVINRQVSEAWLPDVLPAVAPPRRR